MIPAFPEFKNLDWSDKAAVASLTFDFASYSDYNFVSLWSWNTRRKLRISLLNGNLAVLFHDYLTEKPFLSFIGRKEADKTAAELLEFSAQAFGLPVLRLIPEETTKYLSGGRFAICEDEDSHDYMLSTDYLCGIDNLSASSSPVARYHKKFQRTHPDHSVLHVPVARIRKTEYFEIFKRWAKTKSLDHRELNEYAAFERYIGNDDTDNHFVSIYIGALLIGFASYEVVSPTIAVCHFLKADVSFPGIYDSLMVAVGRVLREQGVEYWNFEQDLGIEALRRAKRKYKPAYYLKKYTISF